ncbi:MAG: glycosyltransferase [Ferruginibacter sp.]
MSEKKTILHIINNFDRGGAETLLFSILKELKEYNNIVVTLYDKNQFENNLQCDKYFCLHVKSIYFLPVKIFKLRRIIKANGVDMVHSHLYWPTFAARFATPRRIPMLTTIHTSVAFARDYKKRIILFLDKISYKFRKSIIIGVAKGPLKQYLELLKIKPFKTYVLYNFVDTDLFNATEKSKNEKGNIFKVITVGSLRYPKNYFYLIHAFEKLKTFPVELHIYGNGPLKPQLETAVQQTGANVILKGEVHNIQALFSKYDLYIMGSFFEGFSLSVLEAMAMQMPLLLSDIPSFREQAEETAMYFDLNAAEDCVQKIKDLAADRNLLDKMGLAAKERVIGNFTLKHHMEALRKIYTEALNEKS